jgi:hypothetical protein
VLRSISALVNIDNRRNVLYGPTMNTMNEMLARVRQDDLLREASSQRLARLVERCRRRLFGLLPASRRCQASACC